MAADIALGRLRIALGRLLVLSVSLVACTQEPRPGPPHGILLISLDTLRADYLRSYGYERFDTSPALDAFARESVVFEVARANTAWTRPGVASIIDLMATLMGSGSLGQASISLAIPKVGGLHHRYTRAA